MKYKNVESLATGSMNIIHPCDVLHKNNRLVIEYTLAEVLYMWSGHKAANGSYPLTCNHGGSCVLRFDPDDEMILEGDWVEGNEEGHWRIDLSTPCNNVRLL